MKLQAQGSKFKVEGAGASKVTKATKVTKGESDLTIADALREASEMLRESGVEEARREAGSLLSHVIGRDRTFLITHPDDVLTAAQRASYQTAVERRASGKPLQYVTGTQEFYGLDFEVGPDVLIPRPETELLVETALELLKDARSPLVCDVGTGSGCVAVALAHERADARAFALDISEPALAVAARNAERWRVADRINFLASDCFDALASGEYAATRFDLIASNPPYVAEADLEGLQREVRDHEPRAALTPGGDGLSVIRRLVAGAPRHLKPGGHLLVEIGFGQHEQVAALADARVWTLLAIREDLQCIPRTLVLRLK
jgi:release factor glutamine methyltransferase